MKLFNEEFIVRLICPSNKKLFKKDTPLDDSEKERKAKLEAIFHRSGTEAYAKALMNDSILFSKVAGYKTSTVRAFAEGSCDAPLCDQVIFLCAWLATMQPTWIASCEPGFWVVDRASGYTSVNATDVAEGALGICAKQPVLDQPLDENVVGKLRNVLEEYFFRHLAMHNLHVGIQVPGSCKRASGSDYNPAQAPVQDDSRIASSTGIPRPTI